MQQLLQDHPLVLMEAAVVEQIRRGGSVALHPTLVNAPLVQNAGGRTALTAVYQSFIDVAVQAQLPLLLCTPTWRANQQRVREADAPTQINRDAVAFLKALRDQQASINPMLAEQIKIGGLTACKNDCYLPGQALCTAEAREFHRWQIEELCTAGVDFLIAETLPAVSEAIGIAQAMAATHAPYIISFVIDRNGCVLDGTPLAQAIQQVDAASERAPLGFMVNCVYPSFLCAEQQPADLFERLIGIQANASSLDHHELDCASELSAEPVEHWGALMLELHHRHGLKILGGCCGTDAGHLRYLV